MSTKIQAVQALYSYFSMAQRQSGRPFTGRLRVHAMRGAKFMRDTLQADHVLRGRRFVALTGWRCFVRENALQQNLHPTEKVRLLFAPTMILLLFLAWRAAVFRHQTSLFFVHRGYERYEGKGRECGRRKGRERGLLRSGSRGNGRVSA